MKKYKCVADCRNEGYFTVGKIYELEQDGGLRCDDGFKYGPHKEGTIEWLQKNDFYKFEEVKEMFGKKDLENTMILVGAKGEKLIVMGDKVVGRNDWFPLKDINEDISEYPYEMREVYELSDPLNLGSVAKYLRTNEIPFGYERIWKFEEKSPAELKLEEAEQRLAEAQKAVEEARNEIAK